MKVGTSPFYRQGAAFFAKNRRFSASLLLLNLQSSLPAKKGWWQNSVELCHSGRSRSYQHGTTRAISGKSSFLKGAFHQWTNPPSFRTRWKQSAFHRRVHSMHRETPSFLPLPCFLMQTVKGRFALSRLPWPSLPSGQSPTQAFLGSCRHPMHAEEIDAQLRGHHPHNPTSEHSRTWQ